MSPSHRPMAQAVAAPFGVPAAFPFPARLVRNLALQDWVLLAYLGGLFLAIACGSGPNRPASLQRVAADLAILVTGLVLARGEILPRGTLVSGLVYRASTFGIVLLSYFQLQQILPSVTSRAVDGAIYALDLRLFGVEPALAWDRFVNPVTTEWFAFFYFSYFLLLAVHTIPCLLCGDGKLNARFALGLYAVFCIAHILYTIVPGYGPYAYLAHDFKHSLQGGVFWPLVVRTVVENGAQKDIFPSLHTAVPTYCTVFAFLHRDQKLFRRAFPVLLFWATQIVIATMFLRWHYLIDIVAGMTLAISAALIAYRLEPWETRHREQNDLPPVFGRLLPAAGPSQARPSDARGPFGRKS